MKLSERLGQLDQLQHSFAFKVVASIVIAVAASAVFGTYAVAIASGTGIETEALTEAVADAASSGADAVAAREAMERILAAGSDPTAVGVAVLTIGGLAIGLVWLGLGLTYTALILLTVVIAGPLAYFRDTRDLGLAAAGLASLAMCFTAGMQLLRAAFSSRGAVTSIARNVFAEAVRMKISLVFIVILMLMLAILPTVLDEDQPLRYRIQSFLSFGTGLSFWTIAILTILFSAATVTFEQRDKVIWQTMTKPVSTWQYVLGKWLGVVSLNAVLIGVSATGIFLFTEYLRSQPAVGEQQAYVAAAGPSRISEDRLAIETRVLVGRVATDIEPPFRQNDPEFQEVVTNRVEEIRRQDRADFARIPEERQRVADDLYESYIRQYRAVPPAGSNVFEYTNLSRAAERNAPLNFRHRIDVAGNRPDAYSVMTFSFVGNDAVVFERRLNHGIYHDLQLTPLIRIGNGQVILFDDANFDAARRAIQAGTVPGDIVTTRDLVRPDGSLSLRVDNGYMAVNIDGNVVPVGNPNAASFPNDALQISYAAGSFRGNFARAAVVLWLKLAFLSMLAIFTGTFLSFPVACLVSFGCFMAAEGSSFLRTSLGSFATESDEGNLLPLQFIAANITNGVANLFAVYDDLNPLADIVEGRLITLESVLVRGSAIAGVIALLFIAASYIFSRRELAMYSGK
ncbi:MAG: ABC transporter permease subunit [Planctomycetota bacterium]